MKLNYYLKRIINDKIKLFAILFIIIIPFLDILLFLFGLKPGDSVYNPAMSFFLSSTLSTKNGNIPQILILWFLPIYLLIIVCEDSIEDYQTGYRNILISKWGKKRYIRTNLIKGFVFCFLLMLIALSINMMFCHIIFSGATQMRFYIESVPEGTLLRLSLLNPLLTNIIYTAIASFVSGLVGLSGVAIALAIHNRKLVYPLVFILWFIPMIFDKSSLMILQPYTEYNIPDFLPTFIFMIAMYLLATVVSSIKELKYAKV